MSRSELSLSDEWETPDELYEHLCYKYNIFPEWDVACNDNNYKCNAGLLDALNQEWTGDSWCNPPHSKTEEFVRRAVTQWKKHNINILMIIPANSMCTNYAEDCIQPHAEYHPINRKFCKFLMNGKEKDSSRNGYFVVIWRKI